MKIKSIGKDVKFNEFTCNSCQSIIEYTDKDIEEDGHWSRVSMEESEWHGYKYLICPVCKARHTIN